MPHLQCESSNRPMEEEEDIEEEEVEEDEEFEEEGPE